MQLFSLHIFVSYVIQLTRNVIILIWIRSLFETIFSLFPLFQAIIPYKISPFSLFYPHIPHYTCPPLPLSPVYRHAISSVQCGTIPPSLFSYQHRAGASIVSCACLRNKKERWEGSISLLNALLDSVGNKSLISQPPACPGYQARPAPDQHPAE